VTTRETPKIPRHKSKAKNPARRRQKTGYITVERVNLTRVRRRNQFLELIRSDSALHASLGAAVIGGTVGGPIGMATGLLVGPLLIASLQNLKGDLEFRKMDEDED